MAMVIIDSNVEGDLRITPLDQLPKAHQAAVEEMVKAVWSSKEKLASIGMANSLKAADAQARGYNGDACINCGNFSLRRSGTCLTCEACGTTTGCS